MTTLHPMPQDAQDQPEVTPLAQFVTGQDTRAAVNVFMWKRALLVVAIMVGLPVCIVSIAAFPPIGFLWAGGIGWYLVHNVRANRRS